jgi:hypothetical protein
VSADALLVDKAQLLTLTVSCNDGSTTRLATTAICAGEVGEEERNLAPRRGNF